MMKKSYRFIALLLVFVIFIMAMPAKAEAKQRREILKFIVDGEEYNVRILNEEYDNNMYISLNDVSKALSKTKRAFEVVWDEKNGETNIILRSTEPIDSVEEDEETEESDEKYADYKFKKICFTIDGEDRKFYALPVLKTDCYVNLGELVLSMNIDVSIEEDVVNINSTGEFDFNKYNLLDSGISNMTDSCLVGDVTDGNIYYSVNGDQVVTIASTTKLMTYLIIKDAMSEGKISMSDSVTFSEKASELSKTNDGVIQVEPGKTADILDVMKGMLICSSNECSLALAEHLCGNEEDFVELMNQKAVSLGLSENAQFFNPHGLPMFKGDVLNVKQQNHMTANDMFILAGHILETYPEVTEITSIKEDTFASLGNYKAKNTNQLLYNVPGCVGLKTGTTNKAQSCLVSAYPSEDIKGNKHYILTIVYGCESALTQGYTSMVLMKYGIQRFNAVELGVTPDRGDSEEIPETLEGFIGAVVNAARRNSK